MNGCSHTHSLKSERLLFYSILPTLDLKNKKLPSISQWLINKQEFGYELASYELQGYGKIEYVI